MQEPKLLMRASCLDGSLHVAFLAAMLLLGADRATAVEWLTGVPLEQKLALPADAQWSGTPVRNAINNLARAQGVALLLDRRMDPSRPLETELHGPSLRALCEVLAKQLGGGFAMVGPVGYIGPSETARKLRTLAALRRGEAERLPTAARGKLLKSQPFKWEDLATPRELLEQLAAEGGLTITGLEQVPHDLWAGADLPASTLIERLTLIAGQWDLTFAFDPAGTTIKLVPIPEKVTIERSYPGGAKPDELAKRWQADAPGSTIEVSSGKLVVRGPIEDHERLAQRGKPPAPPKKTAAGPDAQVYTLKLTNVPLQKVVDTLARQLKLEIKMDRQALLKAGVNPDGAISIDVENGTFDELWQQIVGPNLTFYRHGNVLEIMPKK